MADNLRISSTGDDSILEFGRDHSEKLQQLSRSVLSTLYMLVRSAKMYDPDNAVFERPLMSMQDTLNLIISREGRFDLVGIKSSFYVNNMLVKVELNAVENIRYLLDEMRSKLAREGYAVGSVIETIVASPQFLNKRAPTEPKK